MLKIFIVDDHAVFCSGLRAELSGEFSIVGQASTVAEAVDKIAATPADVVVCDVHLPDGTGTDVLSLLAKRGVRPLVLALSVSDAAEDVIAMIRAGARGYVTKTISVPELADAIRRVAARDAVFSPRLAGFVLDAFISDEADSVPSARTFPHSANTRAGEDATDDHGDASCDPAADSLTKRELEVLKLLARGYTYKEIAAELFISVKTVESHASHILRKTQQSNRYALTRWAHDNRLD